MGNQDKSLLTAKLIKVTGEIEEILPKNRIDFTLEELYAVIGCDIIEVIPLRNHRYMILDEEGKLKPNSTFNTEASKIYRQEVGLDDIVGNVVICPKSMFK